MKPPSLAASAAACATASNHARTASASSSVAFSETMRLISLSSSRISVPAAAPLLGLNPETGFLRSRAWSRTSLAIASTSAPRPLSPAAASTLWRVALVSLNASIGPPGSASEIAMPARNGARLTRVHSSSLKSVLEVMISSGSLVAGERLSLEPSALVAILENVGDADCGCDPLHPALDQSEVRLVAQSEAVEPLGLGPGDVSRRRAALGVGIFVVPDEG